jgi:hypothetical protein
MYYWTSYGIDPTMRMYYCIRYDIDVYGCIGKVKDMWQYGMSLIGYGIISIGSSIGSMWNV